MRFCIFIIGLLVFRSAFAGDDIKSLIVAEATHQQIQPKLALAIAYVESKFNAKALKYEPKLKTHSVGVFQILQSTAKGLGFDSSIQNLIKPNVNIRAGINYLNLCVAHVGQDIKKIACCYNAGWYYATKYSCQTPSLAEYIQDVTDAYEEFTLEVI
jgi:soluble lytic murein transglycosylase-like protein